MNIIMERASVLLGFLTLGTMLAIFGSCVSFLHLLQKIGLKRLTSSRGYQLFFRNHLLYWDIFVILLFTHLSMAVGHTGIPQSNDPDAPIHRKILLLGLGALLSTTLIFASCRISRNFFFRSPKADTFGRKTFRSFSSFHAYYWWIVLAFVGVHFFFVHLHIGFWPHGM